MTSEPDPAERARLEDIIALCRKRVGRADEKLQAAIDEQRAAGDALDGEMRRLAQWIRDNPDPQRSIFEELPDV
ncbi:MAG: hypothetical protein ABIV36_22600 [Sphingobium limneticum]